jgi:hypothetical protein
MDPTAEEQAEEERGPDNAGMEDEWGVGVVEEQQGNDMEEWGASVEAHAEDTEEGTRWRVDVEEERAPTGVGKWQG